MTQTKFTKGEWKWANGDGTEKDVCITTDKRNTNSISNICELDVFFDGEFGVEQKANANLIAAAPDMYAMIKELAHELNLAIDECNEYRAKAINSSTESEPDYIDKQTIHEAQLLLKKARGESCL